MAHAAQWEVLPGYADAHRAVAEARRRLVSRRALVGAGVAMVPLPGLDWLTDGACCSSSSPRSTARVRPHARAGRRLAPDRRVVVYKATSPPAAAY